MSNTTDLARELANEADIDWEDLFFDLKNERTVLVLGPEFYSKDGLFVKDLLYKEMIARADHGILHYYPSTGIYLFESKKYKAKAQKQAYEFYKNLTGDHDILQKIIELPFRLIINTNPDKILVKAYRDKGLECQDDFFTWRPKRKERDIADPDRYYPLIYNLFGSIDAYDSIILDFDDIFDNLRTLLNNTNVPEIVRSVLNETDTYIFIGFHLEKWDTQLLFRYLNMKESAFDDSKKNYTTRADNIDSNSESFFRRQFNIKYYGAPVDFLERLYELYFTTLTEEDRKRIEGLSPMQVVELYISEDDVARSLNYLTVFVNAGQPDLLEEKNVLTLIKSNYARYVFRLTKRLDTLEALELERRKLKQSILEFSNGLGK